MAFDLKWFAVVGSTSAAALIGAITWQQSARWERFSPRAGTPALHPSSQMNKASEKKGATLISTSTTSGDATSRETSSMSYKDSFAGARDYWEYALKILPAAEAGDADAQFYLARLMDRCSEDNSLYFQHRGVTLTIDEALQYAVKRNLPVERVQTIYERCHEFQNRNISELGNAAEWLAKATSSGQPLAQTTTAAKIFMHDKMVNYAAAGGVLDPGPSIGQRKDPRDLLRAAVESKDPEVLFEIGELQGALAPTTPTEDKNTRLAWWLIACQRGFDCTAKAEWVINSCQNALMCVSADSPTDLVRTFAADDWPEVQQRALEINAKLEAAQWDDLGLGS